MNQKKQDTQKDERELVTRIPALVEKRGLDLQAFAARCLGAGIRSVNTAKRLYRGELVNSLDTFAKAAIALDCDTIADVVDFEIVTASLEAS